MSTAILIILSAIGALLVLIWGVLLSFSRKFRRRLRAHARFSAHDPSNVDLVFQYSDFEDQNLTDLRREYDLDRIAGDGSETERILLLMQWVHGLAKHAVRPSLPKQMNARTLIRLCMEEGKKINCWMSSTILNDVYSSMGFASRLVHLMPDTWEPGESHFVVSVFSTQLKKWIVVDPDSRGWFTDESGLILNIDEVRQRLIDGRPLLVDDNVDLPYTQWLGKRLQKALYRWYISKNAFRFRSPLHSTFNYESQPSGRIYVELLPDGYRSELLGSPEMTERGNTKHYTNDPSLFWAPPR